MFVAVEQEMAGPMIVLRVKTDEGAFGSAQPQVVSGGDERCRRFVAPSGDAEVDQAGDRNVWLIKRVEDAGELGDVVTAFFESTLQLDHVLLVVKQRKKRLGQVGLVR